MKLREFSNDEKLDEILPILAAVPAVAAGVARGAAAVGGAALRGGAALGGAALRGAGALAKGAGTALAKGAQAVWQATSGMAGSGMDPAQAAMAAKEQQEKKKEIQDAIKAKEQELADLRKQLGQLG